MIVLRESPWYKEALDEGIEQGRAEEAQSLILRQLNRRLGEIAPETEAKIRALSLDQIEALGEALLDFSDRTDLEQWMDCHL